MSGLSVEQSVTQVHVTCRHTTVPADRLPWLKRPWIQRLFLWTLVGAECASTHHAHAATHRKAAAQVQALLGASRAVAFDLTAACSGFVLALVTGAQYIKTGTARNVLVIGADALSRYVDWRDRCAPFGARQALALGACKLVRLPRVCPGPPCVRVLALTAVH